MRSVFLLLFVVVVNIALLTLAQQEIIPNPYYYGNIRYYSPNQTKCDNGGSSKKFAIIVHGWRENCTQQWPMDLMNNLQTHRTGCVLCMDYSFFAQEPYPILRNHFDGIANELTNKVHTHALEGFQLDNIYMFGFSFGAQLVIEAGKRIATRIGSKVKQIDGNSVPFDHAQVVNCELHKTVCEPTGHGFFNLIRGFETAAQNVQCIHTSLIFGTTARHCHQDWVMGNCGINQAAGRGGEFRGSGSHAFCPVFYNASFEHTFPAIPKPPLCISSREAPAEARVNFSMGYFDALKLEGRYPRGKDFFALTYANYPYNAPEKTDSCCCEACSNEESPN